MQKIIKLISVLIIGSLFISNANAISNSELTQNKLTKEVAMTTSQLENDYWDEVTKYLDDYFSNIRYFDDKESLEKIINVLEPIIANYSKKWALTLQEKKAENLFKNIYYRSQLILMYYVW